jgi:hypothetical protein
MITAIVSQIHVRPQEPTNNYNNFVFLHIPKTAGTSIYTVFQELFSPNKISHQFGVTKITPVEAEKLDKFQMISGHISWADIETYFPDRKIITFLRDPIDRCISWYYYAKSLPLDKVIPLAEITNSNSPREAISIAKQVGFEEFLYSEHPHILQNIKNRQTWQLGAHAAIDLQILSEQEVLELAKRNIQKIDNVGFFETLMDDLNSIIKKMGLRQLATTIPHNNKTYERFSVRELPNTVLIRLHVLNNLDILLYEYALTLKKGSVPQRV